MPYISNLEVFIFLFDQKLFIELFNKIQLFIPMEQMIEFLENCAVFNRKNLKGNMTQLPLKNQ